MTGTIARTSVVVAAARSIVWEVILDPATPPRIMPVTEVLAPWKLGSSFRWQFEGQGRVYVVEGRVLRLEADRLLEYDFADPFGKPGHGHRVTIELADEEHGTRVSVLHDNNLTKAEQAHAEGGWRMALNNLKGVAEKRNSGHSTIPPAPQGSQHETLVASPKATRR